MASDDNDPISADEAGSLFADLSSLAALVLAVSGGPDSTALMYIAARWRAGLKKGPALLAVTVDHGLRKEAAGEARAVATLARELGIAHRTLRWRGAKPKTGLPQAARAARYRLLETAARQAGAAAILTAHTLDDQAETVLMRMSRGSGLTGLAGMKRSSVIPGRERSKRTPNQEAGSEQGSGFRVRGPSAAPRNDEVQLIRPFLGIPKARLIATLAAAKLPFADDPTNRDPRFTRARLRVLAPRLAEEGLDAHRLALLAGRLGRAEAALAAEAARCFEMLRAKSAKSGEISFERAGFSVLSPEIALRLLGRAIDDLGDEGPVELGKLESLLSALLQAGEDGSRTGFRRSLAGALVSLGPSQVTVMRAPPRTSRALTKGGGGARTARKSR